MWRIEHPELRPATLDFTSSGQGWRKVTQLFADGIQLINALELVDWGMEDAQFLICEACGIEGCEQGGWVRIRRSDSMVLILPAFDYVWAEREEAKTEYSPPHFLKTHGVAYLEQSVYENLRLQHDSFPSFDAIQPLNMREATLIFHWEAPAQVLGPPADVRVRHELIIGASEVDCVKQMEEVIQKQYQNDSPSVLRPLSKSETPISIYIEASEFIDWKPMVFDGVTYRLVIDSTFVIAGGGS